MADTAAERRSYSVQKETRSDKTREEEWHFYGLIIKVLNDIIRWKEISPDEIQEAIISIIESFNFRENHRFSEVDYSRYENICGYLFRYGAHVAGLARCKVLEGFEQCKPLRIACRKNRERFRVVSLGSGPGSEILGFCSALKELGFAEHRKLQLTIVDNVPEWWECFRRMIIFAKNGQFGNVSELFSSCKVSISSVPTKLPLDPENDETCFVALENADIILISQLLSIVPLYDVPKIMESLLWVIKEDALVLIIDKPPVELVEGRLIYNNCKNFFEGFDVLYLSEKTEYQTLSEGPEAFGFRSNVTSNAWIAVLRKTPSPSKTPVTVIDLTLPNASKHFKTM